MFLRITLILILLGILYLSLTPTETLVVGNDKISHFIAYSVLMLNVGLLTYSSRKKFIFGILLSILFGVMIEVAQHFVPGRFMSFYDVLANAAGVGIGVVLTVFLFKRVNKILQRLRLR
ncbi:MAG: VanZ family protein [Fluviicola sp.]|nr:VanZ family protein [Fluviicola sp.]